MVKQCSKAGCQPVEQVRGQIGPGEYYDVIVHNAREVAGGVPEPQKYGVPVREGAEVPDGVRSEHCVELSAINESDFRICCKTCGKATPWAPKDFPGMENAGADWTRKKWDSGLEG